MIFLAQKIESVYCWQQVYQCLSIDRTNDEQL